MLLDSLSNVFCAHASKCVDLVHAFTARSSTSATIVSVVAGVAFLLVGIYMYIGTTVAQALKTVLRHFSFF